MRRFRAALWGIVVSGAAAATVSAAVPSSFSQGFEVDVAGWTVFGASFTPSRVASGTDGITSADGSYHAKLNAGSLASPTNAATNFGAYTGDFPVGGYSTSLDIYLDLAAITQDDLRFNYVTAVSTPAVGHRRDFAFVIGGYTSADITGPGAGTDRFIINAQTNSGRSSSFPEDASKSPIAIGASGWYTFQHEFYDNGSGVLAVDLSIYDASDALVNSWTISDASDVIGTTVGGNRYGWVSANELAVLAIDNSALVIPEPASFVLLGAGAISMLRRRRA